MYRHLLVPLDATELSAANTADAVQLATQLGARITFMYATPDYAATSEGALDHTLDPVGFAERAQGQTQSILAKAMAAASAAVVPCDSCAPVSDRPSQAIVAAAQRHHCDLIVMASHGGSGGVRALLSRSQTRQVLERTPVALLVTRVAENDPHANANKATAVIQDEHRSLAVVLRGMAYLVEEARRGAPLEREAVQRMHQYLQDFPVQRHHPKEEQSLHRLLRLRSERGDALIDALELQHRREEQLVAALGEAIAQCPDGLAAGDSRLGDLQRALFTLSQAVWAHLNREESELLPLARAVLNEADWAQVVHSFESNHDPRFGELSDEDFRRQFTSIANLMTRAR